MVALIVATLLALTIVGVARLDADLYAAPVYLPLLIAVMALSQRWILAYRLRRVGIWWLANFISFLSLIPLVWSFQRCLGMECFINIGHMSALIWVGTSVCVLQWLAFQRRWRWFGPLFVVVSAGGVGVGLNAGPRPAGLVAMLLIGSIPAIISAFWAAWLLPLRQAESQGAWALKCSACSTLYPTDVSTPAHSGVTGLRHSTSSLEAL